MAANTASIIDFEDRQNIDKVEDAVADFAGSACMVSATTKEESIRLADEYFKPAIRGLIAYHEGEIISRKNLYALVRTIAVTALRLLDDHPIGE